MTRSLSTFMLLLLTGTVTPVAVASAQEKVPVLVRGEAASEGFTDPSKDRQDSVKDLLKKLKDSRPVRVVSSEDEAVAILEVLDRETRRETNMWGRQNKSYLTVRLTIGDYSTEFEGESGSKGIMKGYGAAAGKIVDQLEAWVDANRQRLLSTKR